MEKLQKAGKKIGINTLISWGASIVIIGLTFKILHWEGGEWMIGIGLLVEAGLFFLMGYASLSERNETVEIAPPATVRQYDNLSDVLNANIEPKVLEDLKQGFAQFNKTVESVNSIAGSTATTQRMMTEIEHTTVEIQELRKNIAELNGIYRAQLEAYRKG